MALSGTSATVRVPAIGCDFRIRWTATQNTANNTTTITLIAEASRYSSGGWFTGNWNKNAHTIDGTGSGALTAAGVPQGSTIGAWIEQSRWSRTISHGADGTKTAVLKVRFYQTSYMTYDETLTLTVTLDPISRGMISIGTPGGNKRGQVWIGTLSGNKQAKEVWIGTPSGNKRAT